MEYKLLYSVLEVFVLGISLGEARIQVSTNDLDVLVGDSSTFHLSWKDAESPVVVEFSIDHSDLIHLDPVHVKLDPNQNVSVAVYGDVAGHAVVSSNIIPHVDGANDVFVRVTVQHSYAIYYTSIVVGWIYFLAWSISFYPQVYMNWKRKSVVGLNFDFLALNLMGFVLYSLFNGGLYWIRDVENEYLERNPKGLNPVQINDIVFSLHACFATCVTVAQCFIYERAGQTVSKVAGGIIVICALFLGISLIIAIVEVITWLTFLYFCSYVKLATTLIKYVPQAYMNYRRKSTVGWSIGNIFLDFTGGTLSMLQMILNSYNYNDWASIFGDPTKFGLGLFSVAFDILFMIQHYILYRGASNKEIDLNSGNL
ncbi:cystinosin homolog isoform X2 [Anabrus simplex]|uniref:cystinosin homolog isoform X2 n=1 Tax=Anabrus simplex TaxID=316456 RepID=UPI0035A2F765